MNASPAGETVRITRPTHVVGGANGDDNPPHQKLPGPGAEDEVSRWHVGPHEIVLFEGTLHYSYNSRPRGPRLAGLRCGPGRDHPVERMAVAMPLMVRWSGRRRAARVSAFASASSGPCSARIRRSRLTWM